MMHHPFHVAAIATFLLCTQWSLAARFESTGAARRDILATQCGEPGQPCCPLSLAAGQCGLKGACNAGLTCRSSTCQLACGGIGQLCCAGDQPCKTANSECVTTWTTAQNGANITQTICAQQCGGKDQVCCGDGQCDVGFECGMNLKCKACQGKRCTTSSTRTCGKLGQACCKFNYECLGGGFCATDNICRGYCGHTGQICCANGTATDVAEDGCSDAERLYCEPETNFCTPDCGKLPGQPCCPGSWCDQGFKCNGGKCQELVAGSECGLVAQACCTARVALAQEWTDADGCPNGMYCEKGTCRMDCGKALGQPCCNAGTPYPWCDDALQLVCTGSSDYATCVQPTSG